jgi:hypothetical protein
VEKDGRLRRRSVPEPHHSSLSRREDFDSCKKRKEVWDGLFLLFLSSSSTCRLIVICFCWEICLALDTFCFLVGVSVFICFLGWDGRRSHDCDAFRICVMRCTDDEIGWSRLVDRQVYRG